MLPSSKAWEARRREYDAIHWSPEFSVGSAGDADDDRPDELERRRRPGSATIPVVPRKRMIPAEVSASSSAVEGGPHLLRTRSIRRATRSGIDLGPFGLN